MRGRPVPFEVWLIDSVSVAPAVAVLEARSPRLSPDERDRIANSGNRYTNWGTLRVVLRLLLERYTGPEFRGRAFTVGPAGKPAVPGAASVEFSVSYSGRYGLVALAPAPVGVDLEEARPGPVRFAGQRQAAILAAASAVAPRTDKLHADGDPAVRAWVRLEAWAKARGSGIGALLEDLAIRALTGQDGRSAEGAARARALAEAERILIRDLVLPAGLCGAAATSIDGDPDLCVFPSDLPHIEALAAQQPA